jgi:hypothetical protein
LPLDQRAGAVRGAQQYYRGLSQGRRGRGVLPSDRPRETSNPALVSRSFSFIGKKHWQKKSLETNALLPAP